MSAVNPITIPPVTISATAKVTSTPTLLPVGAASPGPEAWTAGDPTVGTVTIAPDNSSASVVPVAPGLYVLSFAWGTLGFQLTIPFVAAEIDATGISPNVTVTP
jgi:hypothetical protein